MKSSHKGNTLRIEDPKEERTVVTLCPGDRLHLVISDQQSKVAVQGSFLSTTCIGTDGSKRTYVIEPTADIVAFQYLSVHFLGEIVIGTENPICVLVKLFDYQTKRPNIITVVNPFNESIRIQPYEMIEFMYCSDHDKDVRWEWSPAPNPKFKRSAIELDEVGCGISVSSVTYAEDSTDTFYPHHRGLFTKESRVFHFWFRLGKGIIEALDNFTIGMDDYLGRLFVRSGGGAGHFDEYHLDVYCDYVTRGEEFDFGKITTCRLQTLKTLTIPKMTSFDHGAITKKAFPKKMKVNIKKMNTHSLEKGCNVVACEVS